MSGSLNRQAPIQDTWRETRANASRWIQCRSPWHQAQPCQHDARPSHVGAVRMVHHGVPLGVVLRHHVRGRGHGHVHIVISAELGLPSVAKRLGPGTCTAYGFFTLMT